MSSLYNLFRNLIIISLLTVFLSGCGEPKPDHWSELVPDSTPFVIVPDEGATLSDILSAPYIPLFDDITPSAIQVVASIEEKAPSSVPVSAMLLYPDTSNDWQPLWISPSRNGILEYLKQEYQREFEQNRYRFRGHDVEKLFIAERIYYIAEAGDWLVFSESAIAVERVLRTLDGVDNRLAITPDKIRPGSVIMNTPSLDSWVKQKGQVSFRPGLTGVFDGGSPVTLSLNSSSDWRWQLTGEMKLDQDPSILLRSLRSDPRPFTLDRYIPVNTAGFGIFRLEPRRVPIDGLETSGDTDEFIRDNPEIWENIAAELEDEIAFATFAESGAASASEYLYLRKIRNAPAIRTVLNRLVAEELAIRSGNTYSINSTWLAKLFGSGINPMRDFFITVYPDVAAIAVRNGLAESVGGDADRRRVMYYDDNYMEIMDATGGDLSSIFYMDSNRFGTYIQPWLYPQNYMSELLTGLDQFVITTRASSGGESMEIAFTSFERETTDQPYRENWLFPLEGAELTGNPVLGDITGSNRDEIIFSTDQGEIFVLASDGTTVAQASTDGDTPVGPPVIYDWYGNNQNVIMIAAGNNIYAWNEAGDILPNFPINMGEEITTPLIVTDINRNGVAEIMVGTSDRQLHILNSRGEPLNGWPQSTNAVIRSRPLITELGGQRSIFAFAENTLHGWEVNGNSRSDYPVFLPAQMVGTPIRHQNHLLGSGLDGNLYSVGREELFADSLSTSHSDGDLKVQSLQIGGNSLSASPVIASTLTRDEDDRLLREDLVLTQAANGALFLHNLNGQLRLTRTMGQPASDRFTPLITDIDNNQRDDMVALAGFGRLYAWDILSGERLYDLPTSGMNYLIIRDVTGGGNKEIIAQTRDGLRSWTIFETRRERSD